MRPPFLLQVVTVVAQVLDRLLALQAEVMAPAPQETQATEALAEVAVPLISRQRLTGLEFLGREIVAEVDIGTVVIGMQAEEAVALLQLDLMQPSVVAETVALALSHLSLVRPLIMLAVVEVLAAVIRC